MPTTLTLPPTIASPSEFLRSLGKIDKEFHLFRDYGGNWVVKAPNSPSLAKRIKQWYEDRAKAETVTIDGMISVPDKLTSKSMGIIGQLVNDHSTVGEYTLEEKGYYPEGDLGKYGDRRSCFVGYTCSDHLECRHMLNDDDRHGWIFAENTETGKKSRCIVLRSDEYDGHFIVNSYGALSLSDFARLGAQNHDTKCLEVDVECDIYLNGTAWYIGDDLQLDDDGVPVDPEGDEVGTVSIDINPTECSECGSTIYFGSECSEDDHQLLCEDCQSCCQDCGCRHHEDDMTDISSVEYHWVCDDCIDAYSLCDGCDEWHSADEIENGLCWDCGSACDDCGSREKNEDIEEVRNGNLVCSDCRKHYYSRCNECSDWVIDEDMDEDYELCQDCAADKED